MSKCSNGNVTVPPSLGEMLSESQEHLATRIYYIVQEFIVIILISFNEVSSVKMQNHYAVLLKLT